jgi:hypothetical protein
LRVITLKIKKYSILKTTTTAYPTRTCPRRTSERQNSKTNGRAFDQFFSQDLIYLAKSAEKKHPTTRGGVLKSALFCICRNRTNVLPDMRITHAAIWGRKPLKKCLHLVHTLSPLRHTPRRAGRRCDRRRRRMAGWFLRFPEVYRKAA